MAPEETEVRTRQRSGPRSGPIVVLRGDRDRAADAGCPDGRHSALIVPLGSSWAIAPRCTVISVFGAISTVTYCSPSFEMRPSTPPAVTTSSPFCSASSIALRLLRLLLLRPDEQEVEDDEDRDHRQERHQVAAEGAAGALCAYAGAIKRSISTFWSSADGARAKSAAVQGRPGGAGREWKAGYSTMRRSA